MRRIAATVFLVAGLAGQTKDDTREFEAASIRPSNPDATSSTWNTNPGGLTASNWTLKQYVMLAFDVKDYQVKGGPKWVDSDRFDISGKLEAIDGPRDSKQSERRVRMALQLLLHDRFKLEARFLYRQEPGYAIMVEKNGPKLKNAANPSGPPSNKWRVGQLTSSSISIAGLADMLSRIMGSPVVDTTKIDGLYDLTLHWTPDSMRESADKELWPDIYTAIREQLGLKLRAQKVDLQIVAIDHAEKPTEN